MKLKWTSRFSGDMALKALGGTLFSPGALLLVRYFTASVNSFQEGGTSSLFITSREFILFKTLLLILFLLFNTFQSVLQILWHDLHPFQQGLSREASFEIFLDMCDELSPLCTEFICFTKHHWGLWIVSARCLDHLDLAISIISSTSCWSVLRFNIIYCKGGCWYALMMRRIAFLAANAVVRVLFLWCNHPLLLCLFVIADYWELFRMASLKSL